MTKSVPELVRERLETPPFHHWLRPELVSADADRGVVVRLALRDDFRRHPERPDIHGGVIAALIDIAGHHAMAAKLGIGVPTVDLRIDYLRAASGQELRAEAAILKLGRTLSVVDIRVLDDDGRLVAAGRGTFASRAG